MAYNVGSVEVTVLPNAQRFNETLGPQLTERAREIGRDMGDQMADRIKERLATIGDVNIGVDTTKAGLEVDKFLAETKAKGKAAGLKMGTEFGTDFSNAASSSGRRMSPLIVSAIAGGLLAGAPLMLGAAGLLFGGIAAAALHSNEQVAAAFKGMEAQIKSTFQDAAQVAIPFFLAAMQRIGTAVQGLGPQFHAAFAALQGPLGSLTTGLIDLMQNIMPGLVAAVQASGPVFQGLASLLGSIGTGLGQFFQIIAQHSDAAGVVFKALGDILAALLPILGQLVGVGAELGAQILPPLAAVLHAVADALNLIAPVLPAVADGLLVFLGIRAVLPLLAGLAQTLAFASYSTGTFAAAAGTASSAISGLAASLPVLGAILAGFMLVQQRVTEQSHAWAQALAEGGNAADKARLQMSNFATAEAQTNSGFAGFLVHLIGLGAPIATTARAINGAKEASKGLAAAAAAANPPLSANEKSLLAISKAASAASKQTSELKTALDSLSGKSVDLTTAQIQLQQAVASAATAAKGQAGAVADARGQLNVYTAAGQAAGTALIGIRDKGNQLIATMEQQGATSGQVALADSRLRQSFIQTARDMGFSASEAQNLANKILGIPSSRNTQITANTSQATAAVAGLQNYINSLRDKTVTVRVVTVGGGVHVSGVTGSGTITQAAGGLVHAYAGGGIESMPGGIAKIVPPNTLRVIGDRVTDDEAYIPINRDLRSIAIWRQAGQRMGQLSAVGGASGGSARGSFTGNLYLDSGEFLGKVRGEAESVMVGALDGLTARGDYNPS